MRVIAPFLAIVASIATIVAAVVRIRWSAIQHRVKMSQHTGREALPKWVRRVATVWLIFVGGTLTIVFCYAVIKTVTDLSH